MSSWTINTLADESFGLFIFLCSAGFLPRRYHASHVKASKANVYTYINTKFDTGQQSYETYQTKARGCMPSQINKTQKHDFEPVLMSWLLVCIVNALVLHYKFLLQAALLVLKKLYCFFLFDGYVFVFVCLCPFCAQNVLQVSFMCCVFEVLFDVVLPTLCSSRQVACFFHVDVVLKHFSICFCLMCYSMQF